MRIRPPRPARGWGTRSVGLAAALAAAAVACGGGPGCRPASRPNALAGEPADTGLRRAEIVFTTGLGGYIEPCGCQTKPLGGLPRLASLLGPGSEARILVDAGQLLLPVEPVDELTRPQHLEKARLLARAYRRLGVAAINLGPTDLVEGVELLSSMQAEGAVPFVSANVRPRGEAGPEVARSFVRRVGGIRIGLTGVAIPEAVAEASDGVAALEIGPALAAEVRALGAAGAEVVIVLAQVPDADAEALARAVPDIDVILRAPGSPIDRPPSLPRQVDGVVIAEAGRQGQYAGRLRVVLGERREGPLPLHDAGARAQAERARLERKIAALEREASRLELEPRTRAAAEARRRLVRTLEARLTQPVEESAPPSGPHLAVRLVALDDAVPEDDATGRLLSAYYQKLRAMNVARVDPTACAVASDDAPRFVGNAPCEACHAEAFPSWRRSKHALAWETLTDAGKHYDLTCVGCHSVGFRTPGGYCSLGEVEPFVDVGCESCHGPGSAHVAAQTAESIDRADTVAACEGCHVPEHSDGFVYEVYRARIVAPGHGAPMPGEGGAEPAE